MLHKKANNVLVRYIINVLFAIGILSIPLVDANYAQVVIGENKIVQQQTQETRNAIQSVQTSQMKSLAALTALIAERPNNHVAIRYRANILMVMGEMERAKSDLDMIEKYSSVEPMIAEDYVRFWQAKGDRAKQAAALKNQIEMKYDDPFRDELAKSLAPTRKADMLELEGKIDEAVQLWNKIINESSPQSRANKQIYYADFLIRQGKYSDASEEYAKAIRLAESQGKHEYTIASYKMNYALSQWACGKRTGAISMSLEASKGLVGCPNFTPDYPARSVLTAYLLTRRGVGSNADKQKASEYLTKLAELSPEERPYSLAGTLCAIQGKIPMKEQVARVQRVLKAAPYKEWALWSALFLGLSGQEGTQDLQKLIPKETVQAGILDVENKALGLKPESQPSSK